VICFGQKLTKYGEGALSSELEEVGCDRNLPNMKYGEGALPSESWKK
jgi:hypothetical protein